MLIVVYSKQAAKDSKKIEQSNLKETVKRLIAQMSSFEKLRCAFDENPSA